MSFLNNFEAYFERPLKVQMDVTNLCNLNCLYCYNKSNDFSSQKDLTDKEILFIADKVINELTPIVLSLSGGEPLLKTELVCKIVKRASKKDIDTWLTSNTTLLNKQTTDKLKRAGLKKIFTNIDNTDSKVHDFLRGKKGAFDQVVSNLNYAKKVLGPDNITITSVITKHNYKNMDLMVEFLKEKGLKHLKLLDMVPINKQSIKEMLNGKQWANFYNLFQKTDLKAKSFGITITPCHALLFMNKYYQKMKFPFCMAGRFNMVILATGEILPCNHLKFKEFYCGNAIEDSLLDVWQNSPVLQQFRYDLKSYKSCETCERFTKCAGGCKAMSYAFYGQAFKKDPYCTEYKLGQRN